MTAPGQVRSMTAVAPVGIGVGASILFSAMVLPSSAQVGGQVGAAGLDASARQHLVVAGQLPAAAKRKRGEVTRNSDGEIVLRQRAPGPLRVCPPKSTEPGCRFRDLGRAIKAAKPGDTLLLAAGVYRQGAVVDVDGLVIRGEAGAHLKGRAVQGKAALVVRARDVTVEGIECSGISVRDRNGACIRAEGDNLTVRGVYFHDNEQGILSGPAGGTLLVEDSRFVRNGRDGRAHGLYINRKVDTFIFRRNQVLSTVSQGHGVKSRAKRTVIEDNVIASLEAKDSRAIDIPNGGEVVIRRNVLEKGANSANSQMIGLALEGRLHAVNTTVVEDNIIIFDVDLPWIGRLLDDYLGVAARRGRVILSRSPGKVTLRGNTIVGAKKVGIDVAEAQNRIFQNRRAAGLPPYPALPEPMAKRR